MPLYEFICRECEHGFEELVRGDEKVECPQCGAKKVDRLLSVPGAPQVKATSLPTACRSDGPPCGPACSRW
jgi:putative FmdB family regulatory protein